ncbi:MAG: fibronectin type III domain-containing protein [Proteobacteria bacterium]|nr:fibronectin type III domain-containing protein [Pseudomonadota bacterium]
MFRNAAQLFFAIIASTLALTASSLAIADTFTVTASTCQGPGSITEAIEEANTNPGADTIEFDADLSVTGITASSCGTTAGNDPGFFYLGTVSDEVTINGNGANLRGAPRWVTADGLFNVTGLCPEDLAGATIAAEAPGFLRIETGTNVIINDLSVQDLSAIFGLRDNSSVTLNNLSAVRINDWFNSCSRSAIEVNGGDASISMSDSRFEQIQNAEPNVGSPGGTVFRGSNIISGTGTLTVQNTEFRSALNAVQWGGDANIVSSQFVFSGWVNAYGAGTMNIFNSAFQSRTSPAEGDSIRASGNAVINLVASSLSTVSSDCLLGCVSGIGSVVAVGGATISFEESAFGVGLPDATEQILRVDTGGSITADSDTWIQPVTVQNADDLKIITNQPSLLTDPPGLPNVVAGPDLFPQAVTPLLGTMPMPGVLIDAIPDANGANLLLNPIDNSPITTDVFGSPRVDGNGTRTIGAVQVTLAPHTAVTATSSTGANVAWSRPKDPEPTKPITGYGVIVEPTGGSVTPIRIDVSGGNTLSTILTGLMPGTEYRVTVVGVNVDGDGPPSNIVFFNTEKQSSGPPPASIPAVPFPMLIFTSLLLLLAGMRRISLLRSVRR